MTSLTRYIFLLISIVGFMGIPKKNELRDIFKILELNKKKTFLFLNLNYLSVNPAKFWRTQDSSSRVSLLIKKLCHLGISLRKKPIQLRYPSHFIFTTLLFYNKASYLLGKIIALFISFVLD